MHKENQLKYINLLKKELIPALGCTEPIAIAFAAAKAREVLGAIPDRTVMRCSGNIIKNAKSVTVPNSGGRHGIEFAALLGITGGKADLMLETLSSVTEKDIDMAGELLKNGACTVELIENAPPLQIEAVLYKGNDSVLVEIKDSHTNIVRIEKNGTAVFKKEAGADICQDDDYGFLTLSEIYEFVEEVDISEIKDVLFRMIWSMTLVSGKVLKRNMR